MVTMVVSMLVVIAMPADADAMMFGDGGECVDGGTVVAAVMFGVRGVGGVGGDGCGAGDADGLD